MQTSARQRVTLKIDDDDTRSAPIQATADLPAYTTSRDFVGCLFFILRQKGCPATEGESASPDHDPTASEELRLPPGYRVVSLVIEKRVGDEWLPSGPEDLVLVGR